MRLAHCDLAQAESRVVGAICVRLFGDTDYLDTQESGDSHTLICSLCWRDLPWPADFTIEALQRSADRCFPADLISAAKKVAGAKAYREMSYRDLAKRLSHGCLTEDHEVLTPTGWVPISDKPPVIMQSDGTFQTVSHWTDHIYSGAMVEWEGQALSLKMTADHRVYYKIDETGIAVRPAAQVPRTAKITLDHELVGGYIEEPYAALLAAYHCDGTHDGYNSVQFHFHKQRKKDRIKQLADAVGMQWKEHKDYIRLKWHPLQHAPDWSMLYWTAESLKTYMEELPYWDGHQGDGHTTLFSKHRDWLEKWQTFNRIVGHGGNITKPYISGFGSEIYRLHVNKRRFAARASFTRDCITDEKVRVLCPTVPSKAFYVRRNGHICVTGNSNYGGQPGTMARHSHVEVPIIEKFQEAYFGYFPGIKRWHRWVKATIETKRELTTMLGRRVYVTADPTASSTLREMIAYEPQSVATGDYAAAGMQKVLSLNLPLHLVGFCHDALDFEYDRRDEGWLVPAVCEAMSWEIWLGPHPDRYEELRAKVRLTKQEEADLKALSVLAGNPRAFRIPVDAQVGWNLAKRRKDGSNPNGLIDFNPVEPDSRRRIRPVPVSPLERLESILLTKGAT